MFVHCFQFVFCSRSLAESSPYLEALRRRDAEVLFCYEGHDELVLMQLRSFDSHNLTSVEKEMRQDKEAEDLTDLGNWALLMSIILNSCILIDLKEERFILLVDCTLGSSPNKKR